jgi:phage-related baseplate assembly protein
MITPNLFNDAPQTIIDRMIKRLSALDPTYIPYPADDAHLLFEAAADEILRVGARSNRIVKTLFVFSAEGDELDAICANVGLIRLFGAKPTANATFTLTMAQNVTTIIAAGTLLTDGKGNNAKVLNSASIAAGDLSADLVLELDQYIASSEAKTEMIVSALPFVVVVEQNSPYIGGAERETDEALRKRYLDIWEKPSTAGSLEGYRYHAMSADSRIESVAIRSPEPSIVEIAYYSTLSDVAMSERLNAALNDRYTRPLTDVVNIYPAQPIMIDIAATLFCVENSDLGEIKNSAIVALKTQLKPMLGRDITLTKIAQNRACDRRLRAATHSRIKRFALAQSQSGFKPAANRRLARRSRRACYGDFR